MFSLVRGLALLGILFGGVGFAADPVEVPLPPGVVLPTDTTHEMTTDVKVVGTDGKSRLQTLCLDGEGRVLALVAPPRGFGAPVENGFGEVHVFADGKPVKNWKVDFHAQAINVAPNGVIFVAGDGKIAKFDKDGKALGAVIEMPHVTELFKNDGELRKKAEAQLKQQKEQMKASIENARKQIQGLIEKIEAKNPEDRSKTEVKQLEQYKAILKQYDTMDKDQGGQTVDAFMKQIAGRVRMVNGVAISEKDVFIVSGEVGGYGYVVYRFDLDLKNPTKVIEGLTGCCGQMDIQVHGNDLLVAENTKHRFGRYDREGKAIGHYGKKLQPGKTDPECFGSCCNPMNLGCCGKGDIFTAESEGIVKRFSPKGEFLANVGVVKLTGGCKNVAVAASADGNTVYFCDQPGSRFIVLTKKAAEKKDK